MKIVGLPSFKNCFKKSKPTLFNSDYTLKISIPAFMVLNTSKVFFLNGGLVFKTELD